MPFADDLLRFTARLEAKTQAVFVNTAAAALDSIVNGSEVTGSPGQPVDTGELKASWQLEFPSPDLARISTNKVYAPDNEYGVRADGKPYTQRSAVGGRYSVALTVAGADRLLEDEARKLNAGDTSGGSL